jgi:hypothetical protein
MEVVIRNFNTYVLINFELMDRHAINFRLTKITIYLIWVTLGNIDICVYSCCVLQYLSIRLTLIYRIIFKVIRRQK